ncbi:hypothetical protein T492DRAFT_922901, partial [Pavlovales sp. CCMP2436]|mmetsp:Transcript_41463/g.96044  ORF Transcript_41463/g.96044 Transcript_41463/m.96044 type:complete len:217 (+) Transcript_41463:2-652(+)
MEHLSRTASLPTLEADAALLSVASPHELPLPSVASSPQQRPTLPPGLKLATPPTTKRAQHADDDEPSQERPPEIEAFYDSAVRRLPPRFGVDSGERSRARDAWSRMIDEEPGLDARVQPGNSEDEDEEVAGLVGQPTGGSLGQGRGRAAIEELQISSLSARFADIGLPQEGGPRIDSRRASDPDIGSWEPPAGGVHAPESTTYDKLQLQLAQRATG